MWMGLRIFLLVGRKTGYLSALHLIKNSRHTVVGIVTEDYENLVNDGLSYQDFETLAESNGISFWKTDKIHEEEFIKAILKLSPDIGLSIGWRRLVREPLISLPRYGFVNFHSSDLPRYRGFASTSWAILNGDDHIMITAHRMVSDLADEGDILLKRNVPLAPRMDIGDLFIKIEKELPHMVGDLLFKIESQHVEPKPQDESQALFSLPRYPSDGWIDWNRSAQYIDRLVRSVAKPYPGAVTCWNQKKVIIWRGYVYEKTLPIVGVPGHVIGSDDQKSINIITGDGIYVAEEIEVEGCPGVIAPAQMIKGRQQRLGLTQGAMFDLLHQLLGRKNIS
jgi:methionyl-tRNA formyltransferase